MTLLADPEKRTVLLLVLGALAGIGLAGWSLFAPREPSASGESPAVARVNGRAISVSRYRDVLETLRREQPEIADTALRKRVIDRLIEEELLVQRGIKLGLVRRSQRVRSALVQETIQSVLAGRPTPPPDTAALRSFYRENRGYFERPERVRVRVLAFHAASRHDTPPGVRARRARRALAGGRSFRSVGRRLADTSVVPVPRTLLGRDKLVQYLGPGTTRAVFDLQPGEVSEPLPFEGGYRLVHLLEAEGERLPSFDENRSLVRSVYETRQRDRTLSEWLRAQRDRSNVEVGTPRP